MAEFIENHKAFLTPLSPIHIGCGEDFEPTDYVIRENVLYGFDPASVPLTSRERGELASCALKRTLPGMGQVFQETRSFLLCLRLDRGAGLRARRAEL